MRKPADGRVFCWVLLGLFLWELYYITAHEKRNPICDFSPVAAQKNRPPAWEGRLFYKVKCHPIIPRMLKPKMDRNAITENTQKRILNVLDLPLECA